MSDGPHKSLPMRGAWRKLAQRASNPAFETAEIAEAIPGALREDWKAEACGELVRELGEVLVDNRQGSLFGSSAAEKLDALKKISGSGFPLRRLLLECVTQEVEKGVLDSTAISNGVERTLGDRLARRTLQVEEHFRRSTDEGATLVRQNIQQAAQMTSFGALAKELLKVAPGGNAASSKKDGLDDGVALP